MATPDTTLSTAAPRRTAHRRRYLMCRPEHFTVSYTINPWMEPAKPTDTARAVAQWQVLHDLYIELGHDVERAGEAPAFIEWFRAQGYTTIEPQEVNEGEGDFLLVGDTILAGTGFRSAGDSHREVGEVFGREVVSLNLTNPSFYHLDTALSVLDPVEGVDKGGPAKANIAYLPSAFDVASRAILEERYPDAILVSEEDGAVFGLNSASDGYNVIISPRAKGFEKQLRERGYNPVLVDLSELLLGGGGIKCCTLELRGATA